MMKTSIKSQKVATVLKQNLPFVFQELINPEEFGFITIMDIDVSNDQKYADVFIKSIGAQKGFLKRLNGIAPKIAHEIVQKLPNRKKIELRFKNDTSGDLLDKLQNQ
jgi:ribosome-binding factor A